MSMRAGKKASDNPLMFAVKRSGGWSGR